MNAVDIQTFLEDEKVQEIVETNKIAVKLTADSEGRAGNGRVFGLAAGKYYKIEEIENNVPIETSFVKADGTLISDLKDIRKLAGTAITGLTNDVTYRVKSAKPYTNSANKIKYFALSATPDTPKDATVTSGTVTILENRPNCYFDVSATIDATKYYEVMKIKASGTGTESPWSVARTSAYRKPIGGSGAIISPLNIADYERFNTALSDIGIYQYDSVKFNVTAPTFLPNMSIMELPVVSTVNDYVFVEYYDEPTIAPSLNINPITRDFYILTVTVSSAPTNGSGGITITPTTPPTEGAFTLTYNGSPITEGDVKTISLIDTNKTITATGGTVYKYIWFKDGDTTSQNSTGVSITIGSTTGLTAPGIYKITVEGTVGGVEYSKWFILKITP